MKGLFSVEADQTHRGEGAGYCSKMLTHRIPRGYLSVLPTHTRPSLFAD